MMNRPGGVMRTGAGASGFSGAAPRGMMQPMQPTPRCIGGGLMGRGGMVGPGAMMGGGMSGSSTVSSSTVGGRNNQGSLVNQPPPAPMGFDDDIDDEEMERQEAELRAQLKAKEAVASGGQTNGASAAFQPAFDDVDDLSEEELV